MISAGNWIIIRASDKICLQLYRQVYFIYRYSELKPERKTLQAAIFCHCCPDAGDRAGGAESNIADSQKGTVITMVKLTADDKRKMCDELTGHLPKIRELLNVTQADLGALCGFSRTRVSQIENGAIKMTWSQLTSIMFVCTCNIRTKEYIYANRILGPRFLQFIQRKDDNIPPDANITVRAELIMTYDEFVRDYEKYR